MLGKVFKYETKAAGRYLVPAFGLCLGLGLIMLVVQLVAPVIGGHYGMAFTTILQAVTSSLASLLVVALVLGTIGVLLVRFYQAFNGTEGYLTFTLPVRTGTHLWGRILSGAMFCVVCSLIALVSMLLMLPSEARKELFGQNAVLMDMGFGTTPITMGDIPGGLKLLVGLGLLLVLVFGLLSSLLQAYAAVAIGGQFGQHRILLSVVFYFLLNTVESILTLVISAIPVGIYMGAQGGIEALVSGFAALPPAEQIQQMLMVWGGALAMMCLISLVFAVVHFLLCRWLYGKRLNLV
ncbi:hypothetical protein LJC49_06945 [Ruminococcaceae bacterium OttesenSCG-928-I18]|nr:hypothetical protein [Ruminococcaceae bacterium OttesenSCG-928-I18]